MQLNTRLNTSPRYSRIDMLNIFLKKRPSKELNIKPLKNKSFTNLLSNNNKLSNNKLNTSNNQSSTSNSQSSTSNNQSNTSNNQSNTSNKKLFLKSSHNQSPIPMLPNNKFLIILLNSNLTSPDLPFYPII